MHNAISIEFLYVQRIGYSVHYTPRTTRVILEYFFTCSKILVHGKIKSVGHPNSDSEKTSPSKSSSDSSSSDATSSPSSASSTPSPSSSEEEPEKKSSESEPEKKSDSDTKTDTEPPSEPEEKGRV